MLDGSCHVHVKIAKVKPKYLLQMELSYVRQCTTWCRPYYIFYSYQFCVEFRTTFQKHCFCCRKSFNAPQASAHSSTPYSQLLMLEAYLWLFYGVQVDKCFAGVKLILRCQCFVLWMSDCPSSCNFQVLSSLWLLEMKFFWKIKGLISRVIYQSMNCLVFNCFFTSNITHQSCPGRSVLALLDTLSSTVLGWSVTSLVCR